MDLAYFALSGASRQHPGCGSQHPLRAKHSCLAGRCPNNSSLFPPLAAVVVVAPRGEPIVAHGQHLLNRGDALVLPSGELAKPQGFD